MQVQCVYTFFYIFLLLRISIPTTTPTQKLDKVFPSFYASWRRGCQFDRILQVDFFVYDVLLSRPHGDSGSGLSREEYERYTKEIRFRFVSGWWFQRFFIFIPTWGNHPILKHIFQMGWFSHQLGFFGGGGVNGLARLHIFEIWNLRSTFVLKTPYW